MPEHVRRHNLRQPRFFGELFQDILNPARRQCLSALVHE